MIFYSSIWEKTAITVEIASGIGFILDFSR